MGDKITLMESLIITVSSMSIVFIILFLISSVLEAFKYVFKEKKIIEKEIAKGETKSIETETLEMDEEEKVVVALAASIMASKGKKNPNLHVKRVVRIK